MTAPTPTSPYDPLAGFYDAVIGDRSELSGQVLSLIRRNHPQAKTLLDLACGTGAVLSHLPGRFKITGVDLSGPMLTIARDRLPVARLIQQDMRLFRSSDCYDVVICLFDAINHLTKFADWRKVFRNAHRHLDENGVFIFDINTERKLARHVSETSWIHEFGENLLVVDTGPLRGAVVNWNVRIFEHQGDNQYMLYEANIPEISFPPERITAELKNIFRSVQIHDPERSRPSNRSERLVYVCTR